MKDDKINKKEVPINTDGGPKMVPIPVIPNKRKDGEDGINTQIDGMKANDSGHRD